LSFPRQAAANGVMGAKQVLALALDAIRETDTILERLGKIKRLESKICILNKEYKYIYKKPMI